MTTTVTLTPKQEAELAALVAAGDFASIEEAARAAIDETLFAGEIEDDDLEWVKPLLDEARADMAKGNTIPFSEYKAQLNAEIVALGGTPRQ
jgi:Arc/MetJ-type ribon-helix-helix transcriptional regulator